jgi:hypothetical protein
MDVGRKCGDLLLQLLQGIDVVEGVGHWSGGLIEGIGDWGSA